MPLAPARFVQITGTRIEVAGRSVSEAIQALAELKIKRQEFQLLRRAALQRIRVGHQEDDLEALFRERDHYGTLLNGIKSCELQLQAILLKHPTP